MALSGSFLLILSAWIPRVHIRTAFGDILIRGTDGTEGYPAIGIALLALYLLFRSPDKCSYRPSSQSPYAPPGYMI